jgi:hypothetical protein
VEVGTAVIAAGRPDPVTGAIEPVPEGGFATARFAYLGLGDNEALQSVAAGESHLAVIGYARQLSAAELRSEASQALAQHRMVGWQNEDGSRAIAVVTGPGFAGSDQGRRLLATLEKASPPESGGRGPDGWLPLRESTL